MRKGGSGFPTSAACPTRLPTRPNGPPTVSHNTVVVDGVSQRPSGKRNQQWPVDGGLGEVVGKLDQFDPAAKLVAASCDSAYEGLTLRRGPALPALRRRRVQRRTRRGLPRGVGSITSCTSTVISPIVQCCSARSGRLGDGAATSRRAEARHDNGRRPPQLRFTSARQQFRIWIVPTDESPTEVIVAEGPTNSPKETRPMLILRRTAAATRFVTVLGPVNQAQSLRGVRTEKDPDGRQVRLVLEWSTGSDRIRLGGKAPGAVLDAISGLRNGS